MAKGWVGLPPVELTGDCWPLDFAARHMGVSERDLRDVVRVTGLPPAGVMKTASYRRSGRNPRVYEAARLLELWDAVGDLKSRFSGHPGS